MKQTGSPPGEKSGLFFALSLGMCVLANAITIFVLSTLANYGFEAFPTCCYHQFDFEACFLAPDSRLGFGLIACVLFLAGGLYGLVVTAPEKLLARSLPFVLPLLFIGSLFLITLVTSGFPRDNEILLMYFLPFISIFFFWISFLATNHIRKLVTRKGWPCAQN